MKAVVRVPDVEDNFIMPHVDADKIPAVEWNCLCAVLLPAMRQYYGLDEPDGEKRGGKFIKKDEELKNELLLASAQMKKKYGRGDMNADDDHA